MERADTLFYQKIEQNFITFAKGREDIRAAFVVGSRARCEHPADEWSDLDIVFYTTIPEYYLGQQEWLEEIGILVCSFVFQTAGADPERLNLFSGGRQVDFVIHPAAVLRTLAAANTVPANFHRGVRVLLDRENLGKSILPTNFGPPQAAPVSQAAYSQVVNMFWFAALYIAKQLCRGELWTAKMRDYELKSLLLQMIEWYEKTVFGSGYDTWHAGRFLEEWVDPATRAALRHCFGRFELADSWRALQVTADLFQELSAAVGSEKGYHRPTALETDVLVWLKEKGNAAQ